MSVEDAENFQSRIDALLASNSEKDTLIARQSATINEQATQIDEQARINHELERNGQASRHVFKG